jgi:hypothetical protein
LFVFFFPFFFLSIASFFWVLVCKCKHRHHIFFCRGLEEFSLLARILLAFKDDTLLKLHVCSLFATVEP